MVDFNIFKTGKEWTGDDKPYIRNIYKLKANEGFWITDNVIYETSCFAKSLLTTVPDNFGTVSDEEKEAILLMQEEAIQEALQESEAGDNGSITEL